MKGKSREPKALNQKKIDRQGAKIQRVRWLWWMVFGVEMGGKLYEEEDESG